MWLGKQNLASHIVVRMHSIVKVLFSKPVDATIVELETCLDASPAIIWYATKNTGLKTFVASAKTIFDPYLESPWLTFRSQLS